MWCPQRWPLLQVEELFQQWSPGVRSDHAAPEQHQGRQTYTRRCLILFCGVAVDFKFKFLININGREPRREFVWGKIKSMLGETSLQWKIGWRGSLMVRPKLYLSQIVFIPYLPVWKCRNKQVTVLLNTHLSCWNNWACIGHLLQLFC